MPVAFDNTMLTILLNKKARIPADKDTGKPVDLAQERAKYLVQSLAKMKKKIIIPTPVTAEILTAVGPNNADYLRIINRARVFDVKAFDEIAAMELAFLNRDVFNGQDKKSGVESRQKVKVDRQILAICKVARCDTLYTDDLNLGRRAAMCDIKAIGVAELPIPDSAKQGELELEPHEDIPEEENDEAPT